MKFEVSKPNGERTNIDVALPDDVMEASPSQLRLMEAEYH